MASPKPQAEPVGGGSPPSPVDRSAVPSDGPPAERTVPEAIQTGDGTSQVTPAGPASGGPPTPAGAGPGIMQFAALYIGDLHPEVGEAMLYESFETAGRVASCRVCRDSVTRRSLGYGYVNFYSAADAERALDILNYMKIKGKPCRLMWSQKDPKNRMNTNSNVFVKQLDPKTDSKALHDHFIQYGKIVSCKVSTNSEGKSRCYGFVNFETEELAKAAIEKSNGSELGASKIFVGPFQKREEMDAEAFTNLYVKQFPPSWDEPKLSEVFAEFGEVVSVWLSATDDGKKFALVNFKLADAAKAAVEALHSKDMTSEGLEPEAPKEGAAGSSAAPAGDVGEAAEGEPKVEKQDSLPAEDDLPSHLLYVQRAQTRAERKAALDAGRKRRKGAGKGADGERPGVKLCVMNLAEDATDQSLRELFEPFGKVLGANVRTKEDGKCKGLGFVVLSSAQEAEEATGALHKKVIGEGRPLNVAPAERRQPQGRRGEDGGEGTKGSKGGGKGRQAGNSASSKGKGKGVPPLPFGGAPPPFPRAPPAMVAGPGRPTPGANCYAAPTPAHVLPPPPYAMYPQPRMPYGVPGYPGVPMMMPHAYARPPMPMPMPYGMPRGMPQEAAVPQGMAREALARMPPQMQKQMLGQQLFGLVSTQNPQQAGKITGMILELNNDEILALINAKEKLQVKIEEAVRVLDGPKKKK